MFLGALILFWFPLRGERLAQMRQDVLALHARKKARAGQTDSLEFFSVVVKLNFTTTDLLCQGLHFLRGCPEEYAISKCDKNHLL